MLKLVQAPPDVIKKCESKDFSFSLQAANFGGVKFLQKFHEWGLSHLNDHLRIRTPLNERCPR